MAVTRFDSGFERYMCNKVKIGVSLRLPWLGRNEMDLEKIPDYMSDEFVYQLRVTLAEMTHEEKTVNDEIVNLIEVPNTWWDSFKLTYIRHLPKWFLRKYPVRSTTHHLVVKHITTTKTVNVCPHIDVPRDGRDHFEFMVHHRGPVPPFKR